MSSIGEPLSEVHELTLNPPSYSRSIERWEERSWQVKSYVSLFKPHIAELLESVEGKADTIDDKCVGDWEKCNNLTLALAAAQQTPGGLVPFSKQVQYLLANLTNDAAKLTVRLNNDGNGFDTWRALYERVSLPGRARSVNYLSRTIDHRLRDPQLQEFITSKNKHEKATGKNLDDDLLLALLMTQGPLQQHLRLNFDAATTFDELAAVLQTARLWYQSRHITGFRSALAGTNPVPTSRQHWSDQRKKRKERKRKRILQKLVQRILEPVEVQKKI